MTTSTIAKRLNTATYAGHTWNLGGEIALTRAQKNFIEGLHRDSHAPTFSTFLVASGNGWTTTQFRRLAPFIALNSKLIEELPRTARGGWGYRLRSEAKP